MRVRTAVFSALLALAADLAGIFDATEARLRVGETLTEVLKAEQFASQVWDSASGELLDPVTVERREALAQELDAQRLMSTTKVDVSVSRNSSRPLVYQQLQVENQLVGDLLLTRGAGQAAFTEDDREAVALIAPHLATALLRINRFATPSQSEWPSMKIAGLGKGQRRVAEQLPYGFTDAQIASRLSISVATVRTHLRAIYKQLNVRNRTQAAKLLAPRLS